MGAPKPVAGPAPSEEVPESLHGVFRSASPAQREIWLKAAGMRGPFRVSDLIDSDVDRAPLQHTLSILEQLGLLICERDGVIASWRLPHPEDDLVA